MVGNFIRVSSLSFLAVLLLGGCAQSISTESTLAKRLTDRGPVPLSPNNPFIASNLLLNKEMERSPELKGFIEHRGQPTALKVERSLLGPLQLTLFYADNGERFELERVEDTWVISGRTSGSPILTNDGETVTTAAVQPTGESPPEVVRSAEGIPTSGENDALMPPTVVVAERISPLAPPQAEVRASLKDLPFSSPAEGAPSAPLELPENRADLLLRLIDSTAGQLAEISPKGDVVHYITQPSESFALVAEWYTDSPLNGPRIARMNGRRPTDPLEAGDAIVIPSYLVTNKNHLSEEAIKVLSAP